MADSKKKSENDVSTFMESIESPSQRKDAATLIELMEKLTGHPATLWRSSIVGFGTYHYKYESGREGDWFLTGFSPRKNSLSIYILAGFDQFDTLMDRLGKYKTGKGCLYVKNLQEINLEVLTTLINESVQFIKMKYS